MDQGSPLQPIQGHLHETEFPSHLHFSYVIHYCSYKLEMNGSPQGSLLDVVLINKFQMLSAARGNFWQGNCRFNTHSLMSSSLPAKG